MTQIPIFLWDVSIHGGHTFRVVTAKNSLAEVDKVVEGMEVFKEKQIGRVEWAGYLVLPEPVKRRLLAALQAEQSEK